MKRAVIIHYTDRGEITAGQIAEALRDSYEIERHRSRCDIGELFSAVDALIFVGACGIAIRAIAPFVCDKTSDPGVIVVDELGIQAISLLSGHIGGANELTRKIAAGIGAIPVITTATDINHRFATDEWAAKNGLHISSMQAAKRFATEILKQDLPVYSDFPITGRLTGGLYRGSCGKTGLVISCRKVDVFDDPLVLIPKKLHLGIGCRRGTPAEKISDAVEKVLDDAGIYPQAIAGTASIDVKKDESGLLAFCCEQHLPVQFFNADALNQVPGNFSASEFVKNTVGVDNVCERAAMLSAGAGAKLIVKKTCADGVTIAVAQEEWSVHFE